MLESLSEYQNIPAVSRISDDELRSLEIISGLFESLEGLDRIPEVPRISESLTDELRSLYMIAGLCSDLNRNLDESGKIDYELNSLNIERDKLLYRAKKEGKAITTCPNCGTLIEINEKAV